MMTQNDFAESIDINQSMLSRYESGQTQPTADVLISISRKYGVSVDWLCDVDSEIAYNNTGDFARFLIELQEAENVSPVFTASNKKESKEDPRGPYADIRFYKNDSEENLQIYEMLLQALGNDIKVTKQGREYEISNTERDIKEELKKLEKESLPIIHNKSRLPEED